MDAPLTNNFDNVNNDRVQERIGLADIHEESSGVREDELDTRNLLTTEDTKGADESSSVGRDLPEIAPFGLVAFVVLLGVSRFHQDGQFGLGVEVIVLLVEAFKSSERLVVPALGCEPSGGFDDKV